MANACAQSISFNYTSKTLKQPNMFSVNQNIKIRIYIMCKVVANKCMKKLKTSKSICFINHYIYNYGHL